MLDTGSLVFSKVVNNNISFFPKWTLILYSILKCQIHVVLSHTIRLVGSCFKIILEFIVFSTII